MKNNIKVSVIVPVYNVSKYLRKCLDSIVKQTLKEIEIIVVNDCSPDPLDDEICREYERLDSRIKYIKHEKNKKQGGARNTGILQAKGTFLGFVDSDDYIHKDMYKVMYEQAIKNDCDLVNCNIISVDSEYNERISRTNKKGKIFDDVGEKIKIYLRPDQIYVSYGVPNKIVHRDVFLKNNLFFEENVIYEDCAICLKLLFYSRKIIFITDNFYYYYQRENSTTGTFKFDLYKDGLLYLKQNRDFLKEKRMYSRFKNDYQKRYRADIFSFYLVCYKSNRDRIQEFEDAVKRDEIYSESKRFRIEFKLIGYVIRMNLYYFVVNIYKLKNRLLRKFRCKRSER